MECRESFSLLTRYGRYSFFSKGLLGNKWARKFVLKDTFKDLKRLLKIEKEVK